jgi:hypothetical protein
VEEPARNLISVYSPHQIYVASFVGGPLGGAWFLSRNYRALSNATAATRSLLVGCVAVILILPLTFVLPEKFPNLVIPIAYSFAFYYFANTQFAVDSAQGIRFGKGWRHWTNLIGISIFWLAVTTALWMGGLVLLNRVLPGVRP